MGTRFTQHFHMATGINVIIEIIPAPPYVIVIPEPIATVTAEPDGDYFSDHEHEMLDLPSLDVGFSVQGKIGNIFMSHSHFFNSTGISISPPGPYTMNVVYTPPPLDILGSTMQRLKEEYIEEVKKDYLIFFKETVKVIGTTVNFIVNNKKIYDFNNYINYYINNNLKKINAKFSNNK